MCIFQINVVLNTGSTGRIVEGINSVLQEQGIISYCYYGRGSNNNSTSVNYGPNSTLDINHHVFLSRLFDKHGLGSKDATQKLVSIIKDVKPQVIHLHNIHGYYLNYPILFKFLEESKIPVVWTLHDCWPFTGHCAYFDYANCDKWKKECYDCPNLHEYPKTILLDKSRNNYLLKKKLFNSLNNLTLVPVSNWLKNILKESFLNKFAVNTIHNGIDLNVFDVKENIDSEKIMVLGVANVWDTRKGLSDFLQLSKRLDDSIQIVLVGLDIKQLNDLPQNITGVTRTESIDELAQYYSRATAFVNPTYEDNFPTTNLEALACGTPVITYDTGGSPEAIDEHTGFVVEKGNIEGLVEKIEIIKTKGKNHYQPLCRARAVKYYNKDDRFQDYISLYKKLINENLNK